MRYLSAVFAWTLLTSSLVVSLLAGPILAESSSAESSPSEAKTASQKEPPGLGTLAQAGSQPAGLTVERGTVPALPNPTLLPQPTLAQQQSNPGYWRDAQRLLQRQIILVDRLEQAFKGPDPNLVRAVDGQILLHVTAVERFQRSHYSTFPPECLPSGTSSATTASADPATQLLCSLSANAKALEKFRPKLYERLEMLATIAEVRPLPLVSGERTVGTGGMPQFERGNLRKPAAPVSARAPYLQPLERPLLGRPVKSPLGDYIPPVPPAISAPQGVPDTLDEVKTRLNQAERAFPQGASAQPDGASRTSANRATAPRFFNPRDLRARADRNAFEVSANELKAHQKFLAKPHTGISRVLATGLYNPDPNILRNRLDPTIEERYPYAILVRPQDPPLPQLPQAIRGRLAPFDTQRAPFVPLEQTSFRPRLALQIDGNQVRNIMRSSLDYGFMYDLGPLQGLDLNSLSAGLMPEQIGIRSDVRQLFLNYQPPKKLENVMAERRRFMSGKTGPNNLPSILSPNSPMELNHTYVLRTFQFQVPEPIATGRPLKNSERKNLKKILEMPSSDVLVVFRPIARRPDGSYTILWRVLGQFTPPEVTDLAAHVSFKN